MPLGFLAPVSHFSTLDSLVLRERAKTGWLTRWRSHGHFICRGSMG